MRAKGQTAVIRKTPEVKGPIGVLQTPINLQKEV
jgi:hypothetical protein